MNDDNLTTEYKKKWEQVKLSDSSRLKMGESLLEYARFHAVSEVVVPVKRSFMWLHMKSVQALVAVVLVVSAGSALYLGGDRTYNAPLATTEVPIVSPADPAPESGTESQTTEQTPDHLAVVPKNNSAVPVEEGSADVLATNARSIAMKESADAVSDEAMMTTMLSQGEMSIEDYWKDVAMRPKVYRNLLLQHKEEIDSEVYAELIGKLNQIDLLTNESVGKEESKARPLLDKAMTLVGEVESTLSLLGTVTVEDGVITDIAFPAE